MTKQNGVHAFIPNPSSLTGRTITCVYYYHRFPLIPGM